MAAAAGDPGCLSGGRLVARFSVDWSAEEHEQMDVDSQTRGRRCGELIEALIACWDPIQSASVRVLHGPGFDRAAKATAAAAAAAGVVCAVGARACPHNRPIRYLESLTWQFAGDQLDAQRDAVCSNDRQRPITSTPARLSRAVGTWYPRTAYGTDGAVDMIARVCEAGFAGSSQCRV